MTSIGSGAHALPPAEPPLPPVVVPVSPPEPVVGPAWEPLVGALPPAPVGPDPAAPVAGFVASAAQPAATKRAMPASAFEIHVRPSVDMMSVLWRHLLCTARVLESDNARSPHDRLTAEHDVDRRRTVLLERGARRRAHDDARWPRLVVVHPALAHARCRAHRLRDDEGRRGG